MESVVRMKENKTATISTRYRTVECWWFCVTAVLALSLLSETGRAQDKPTSAVSNESATENVAAHDRASNSVTNDGPSSTLAVDTENKSLPELAEEPTSAVSSGTGVENVAALHQEIRSVTNDEPSSEGAVDMKNASRPGLTKLPGFLVGIQIGPFVSLGQWVGVLGEIEFDFKLHSSGYLGLLTSLNGGYQFANDRTDILFSETLGYRHYFIDSHKNAWTILAGGSLGYYWTSEEKAQRGYDWMHVGLRARGGYRFFMDERFSIGVELGFTLAYQFEEFVGAKSFVVLIPEALVTFTF
jgi:hypothetical protein